MTTDGDKTGGRETEPHLAGWKKALFGIVATVLFFVLLELVLAAFRVKPLLYENDPYVGFASKIPLFVEQGGRMVTAENKTKWFNEQSFPRPKQKGTLRIFCVGGSTTYGRPFRDATSFCGWLRELLPFADPSKSWQVINAGGISYASYRVAALMEELAAYDPDLFIIYCGHNEFLERRTYGELIDTPSPIRGLQAGLSGSRVYSLMARVVKHAVNPPRSSAANASILESEVKTILDNSVGPEDYTRDENWKQQVLSHYRFNLARMVDIARASGAKVIFVMPAANLRDSSPFKSENRDGLNGEPLARWRSRFADAREAYAKADTDTALSAINEALAIDPQHAGSHYLRGRILETLEKYRDAKVAYELALENDVCPLRMLARMRAILSEVAAARDVPVVDFRGLVTTKAANAIPGGDQFLDHVHPTIQSNRMLALALVDSLAGQGIVNTSDGWGESAIAAVTAEVMAGVDDNERGIALRNLANVLQWAGKYEDAYSAARKSLQLTPRDAYANFVAGELAEKLGRKDEAMQQYKFITEFELNPGDAPYFIDVHYKYAALLNERGDFAEAVRMLEKTLRLKPDHKAAATALPLALKTWGTQLLQSGSGERAIEPLKRLLQIQPDNPNVRNWLGIALIQANQPGNAIPHLQAAIRSNPNNAGAHNNIATAFARIGDKQKAAEHFQETLRLKPGHVGAIGNLAQLHFESGEFPKAEHYFKRLLELKPDNAEAIARLAEIQNRQKP